MMLEAGVVLDRHGTPLYWHVPHTRTAGSLPDDRTLWVVMWEHRENLAGFAHSHPGRGVPGPSYTDVTTFRAIEAGLGRRLHWWICSEDEIVVAPSGRWIPEPQREYHFLHCWAEDLETDPFYARTKWLDELRRLSYK